MKYLAIIHPERLVETCTRCGNRVHAVRGPTDCQHGEACPYAPVEWEVPERLIRGEIGRIDFA